MKIFDKNGSLLLDIEVNDTSYRYRSIMRESSVTLNYSLTDHVEIPLGSYILLSQGERYTMYKPANLRKKGSRNFEYTVIFEDDLELLKKYKYKLFGKNPKTDGQTITLKFALRAEPQRFLDILVENLNYTSLSANKEKWIAGRCLDVSPKEISFNQASCYDALVRIASEFNTEWEIEGRTIHLGKVERFKDDPLPLSYGKGKGFKTGVGRLMQSEKSPVTHLFVQGGGNNINSGHYGNDKLLLPKNETLVYEDRVYKTDENGLFVTRADHENTVEICEGSLDASHIYPRWEGVVDQVIDVDPLNHIYDFIIENPGTGVDFSNLALPGEKIAVQFHSGQLAGHEFFIDGMNGYHHKEGRFRLARQLVDGIFLPNTSRKMNKGDRFSVLNIDLPENHICNDAEKTGDSWDMFREAARYLYELEGDQFGFTGELDGIWAKKNRKKIDGRIVPGSYIGFSDPQFQPEGIRIRITGVKDYINNPYSPEIELSNAPVLNSIMDDLDELEDNAVIVEENHREAKRYSKRYWNDAIETMGMLEEAVEGFSEGIKPIWVQAMSVLVGDENLQFKFTDQSGKTIVPDFKFDGEKKVFHVTHKEKTQLIHLTLGGNTLSPESEDSNHKKWTMEGKGFTSNKLESSNPYYLYAKCQGDKGFFVLSLEPLALSDGDINHFLVGTLSSEYQDQRTFVTVYGYTEILPGRMTVDRIISTDGDQYWDMAKKEFKIGDKNSYLGYNLNQDGRLVLKGTLVQSPSGEQSPIGANRGEWKVGTTYYEGDLVTYAGSTYRCTRQVENTYPTDKNYWALAAGKGANGPEGPQGPTGPAIAYRGEYKHEETYCINELRLDVVYNKSDNTYYCRHGHTEEISGYAPPNRSYWKSFGASFSSVATDLLLAQEAHISGWNFNKQWIWSQDNTIVLNGNEDDINTPVIAIGSEIQDGNKISSKAVLKLMRDGSIHASKGIIGGFSIREKGLFNTDCDATLEIGQSGYKFLRINAPNDAMLVVRNNNENEYAIRIDAANAIGIYITANMGGTSIKSHGSCLFHLRKGENFEFQGIPVPGTEDKVDGNLCVYEMDGKKYLGLTNKNN